MDDATSPGSTYNSIEAIANQPFRRFVSGILSHVQDRRMIGEARFVSREGAGSAALVFARLPVVTSGDQPLPPPPSPREVSSGCRVESPWFEFTVQNGTSPALSGVFLWNERQILQDQAFLDGAADAALAPREPLGNTSFQQFARLYEEQAIASAPATRSIEPLKARIPADILFLFTQAPQSTRGPFANAARGAVGKIADAAVDRQVRLATALIERCLETGSGSISINSVGQAEELLK